MALVPRSGIVLYSVDLNDWKASVRGKANLVPTYHQAAFSEPFSKDAVHSSTVTTSFANRGQINLCDASLASWEKPAVQSDLDYKLAQTTIENQAITTALTT